MVVSLIAWMLPGRLIPPSLTHFGVMTVTSGTLDFLLDARRENRLPALARHNTRGQQAGKGQYYHREQEPRRLVLSLHRNYVCAGCYLRIHTLLLSTYRA